MTNGSVSVLIAFMSFCSCGDSSGQQTDSGPVDADRVDASPVDAIPPGPDPFWTAISADGPGLRDGAGLAFDRDTQRLILFGGCLVRPDGSCLFVNDVWVLDLSSGLLGAKWTELAPAGVAPFPTFRGMTTSYDPVSGRMLAVVAGTSELELWALEDANGLGTPRWRSLTPTGPAKPSWRKMFGVTHDPTSNRLYMFGGLRLSDFQPLGDMWVLQNASGSEVSPEWILLDRMGIQPPARTFHSGVLDATASQMFIFAGGDNAGMTFTDGWQLGVQSPVTAERIIDVLPAQLVSYIVGYNSAKRTVLFLGCRGTPTGAPCRYGAVWHLRLDNPTEPLLEVILPAEEGAPFNRGTDAVRVYDEVGDRLFLFNSVDVDDQPENLLWVLSNASAE